MNAYKIKLGELWIKLCIKGKKEKHNDSINFVSEFYIRKVFRIKRYHGILH